MKFFISVLMTALVGYAACLLLPWWSIAIVAFLIAAIIPQRPGMAFLAGFTGIFVLWLLLSVVISSANDHLLAHKISQVIIKTDSPVLLMLATAFIGALVAGSAAWSGSLMRRLFPSATA